MPASYDSVGIFILLTTWSGPASWSKLEILGLISTTDLVWPCPDDSECSPCATSIQCGMTSMKSNSC